MLQPIRRRLQIGLKKIFASSPLLFLQPRKRADKVGDGQKPRPLPPGRKSSPHSSQVQFLSSVISRKCDGVEESWRPCKAYHAQKHNKRCVFFFFSRGKLLMFGIRFRTPTVVNKGENVR